MTESLMISYILIGVMVAVAVMAVAVDPTSDDAEVVLSAVLAALCGAVWPITLVVGAFYMAGVFIRWAKGD